MFIFSFEYLIFLIDILTDFLTGINNILRTLLILDFIIERHGKPSLALEKNLSSPNVTVIRI